MICTCRILPSGISAYFIPSCKGLTFEIVKKSPLPFFLFNVSIIQFLMAGSR